MTVNDQLSELAALLKAEAQRGIHMTHAVDAAADLALGWTERARHSLFHRAVLNKCAAELADALKPHVAAAKAVTHPMDGEGEPPCSSPT